MLATSKIVTRVMYRKGQREKLTQSTQLVESRKLVTHPFLFPLSNKLKRGTREKGFIKLPLSFSKERGVSLSPEGAKLQ